MVWEIGIEDQMRCSRIRDNTQRAPKYYRETIKPMKTKRVDCCLFIRLWDYPEGGSSNPGLGSIKNVSSIKEKELSHQFQLN